MRRVVLTEKGIAALKPIDARYSVGDTVVPGLVLRVGKSGKKTFALFKRLPAGRHPVHLTLGTVGALTLVDARTNARRWIEQISSGVNPVEEQKRQARAEAAAASNRFEAVVADYMALVVIGPDPSKPRQRKGPEVKRDFDREFIPRWRTWRITEIAARDITPVLDEALAKGHRAQARNLLGHLRRFFSWAIARDCYGLTASPVDRMKPKEIIGKRKARDRVLTDDEIRAMWRAAGEQPYPYGPMYKLLLLTGQRRNEVAESRWREFDLERKLWTIPAERMKSDRGHSVPLSDDVVTLLQRLPRFERGDYLFTFKGGAAPLNSFAAGKRELDRLIGGVVGWTVHDIRRSVRTRLSAIPGISDLVRELVIAHAKPGLHAVYDLHGYEAEKRYALTSWAEKLRTILEPSAGNVVALRA